MITFVYGAPGSGKTHYVFERLKDSFENAFLIVPEQQTVTSERLALETMPAQAQLTFEVLNFSRLCNRVFRKYGGLSCRYISPGQKQLYMWRTLRELSPLLEEYRVPGGETALTPIMLSAVSELRTCRVRGSELESAAKSLPDGSPLHGKLRDIALISSAYAGLVRESFDDAADDLDKLALTLESNRFFDGSSVYLDSFTSFTAQETAVLRRIISQAQNVVFTLGCESPLSGSISSESIEKTARRLEELAKDCGQRTERIFLTENHRASNLELKLLSSELWNPGRVGTASERVPEAERGSIEIIRASDPYDEADAAAALISGALRDGLRRRDIAVILRDASDRAGIIDAALEAAGIPCFTAQKTDPSSKPPIRLLTTALKMASRGCLSELVKENLKTGLYPIEQRDIDMFCEYTDTWGITGKRFGESWSMNPDGYTDRLTERGKRILSAANSVRETLFGILGAFFAELRAAENVRGMCSAVWHYFESISLNERLRALAAAALERGERREASDTLALSKLLADILDDLVSVLGDEKLSAEEFAQATALEIAASEIGSIPTGSDEVTIGSASLIRTGAVKYAVILGLNEGEFPRAVADNGIFSDSDRAMLGELGITLSSDSSDRAGEELLYARRAMTLPSDRLSMLFCERGADGRVRRPSMLIRRVTGLFDYIKEKAFSDMPPEKTIWYPAAAADRLPFLTGTPYKTPLRSLLTRSGLIPRDLRIALPDASVTPETAERIFGDRIILSQSKIDEYVMCSFNYYCRSLLGLRTDEKAEMGYRDMGTLIHTVLERSLRGGLPQDIDGTVSDIIRDEASRIFPDGEGMTNRMSHLLLRVRRLSAMLLRSISDELVHSKFRPCGFELPIGGERDPDPMIFTLTDGTSVSLRGQIDRVDILRRNGEVFLRVVDYKTGSKEFDISKIADGQGLQLLIYLFYLCRPDTSFAASVGCRPGQSPIPAAANYISSNIKMLKLGSPIRADELNAQISMSISRKGVYSSDLDLLRALNDELKPSMLGNVRFNKNGSISGAVDSRGFDNLKAAVADAVMRVAGDMKRGYSIARPLNSSADNPCRFCRMNFVCRSSKPSKKR